MIDSNDAPFFKGSWHNKTKAEMDALFKEFLDSIEKYAVEPSLSIKPVEQQGVITPLEPLEKLPALTKAEKEILNSTLEKITSSDPETGYLSYSFNSRFYDLKKSKDGFYTLTRRKTDEKEKEPRRKKPRKKGGKGL